MSTNQIQFNIEAIKDIKLLALACPLVLGWLLFFIGTCMATGYYFAAPFAWFVVFYIIFMTAAIVLATLTQRVAAFRLPLISLITLAIAFLAVSMMQTAYSGRTAPNLCTVGGVFMVLPLFLALVLIGYEGDVNELIPSFSVKQESKDSQPPLSPSMTVVDVGESAPPTAFHSEFTQHQLAPAMNIKTLDRDLLEKRQSVLVDRERSTANYSHRAEALYSYSADPEDPSELSFSKGDVLQILDTSGKWWQAKRDHPDGTFSIGIAPSNYLKLIS